VGGRFHHHDGSQTEVRASKWRDFASRCSFLTLCILKEALNEAVRAGSLTTDGHLAALSVEHGAQLVSFDRDFGRFPGLRWRHPADDLSEPR